MKASFRSSVLFVVLSVSSAQADVWLRGDGSATTPVSTITHSYFGVGGSGFISGELTLGDFVDVVAEGGYGWLGRSDSSTLTQGGSFIAIGPSLRLHSFRIPGSFFVWLQGGADYIRTGPLDRAGLLAGIGVNYMASSGRFAIGPHLQLRHILAMSDTPEYPTRDATLVSAGLTVEYSMLYTPPVPPDRDGDGVPDARDACPDVAAPGEPDGCPPRDSDGDGVIDRADECPKVPGIRALRGCPDPDPDKDGVLGADDICPNLPGLAALKGCPDRDSDGDSLLDLQDECPDKPGPVALRGCPDRDADTVADRQDKCPDVPGLPEESGCPRYEKVKVTEEKIEILQKIFFAFGLTKILPRSYPLLDEVTKAVRDRAPLCVRIEGHTDIKGKMKFNMKLSQGRADAVRAYMTGHGVTAEALESKGYGPTLPLDDNKTAEGREKNRRVEFVIVPCAQGQQKESP